MIDYFALLEQPRRPWLDPEGLKATYQEITLGSHPDRRPLIRTESAADDPATTRRSYSDFAEVNEAYRVLSDPKLRLQHLLRLEGGAVTANETTPGELMDLFSEIGAVIAEIDRLLETMKDKSSVLTRSLMRPEILKMQTLANDALGKLRQLYQDALRQLREVDARWNEQSQNTIPTLNQLYHRLSYLMRWMDQIEERLFQLSI